jgi:glycosyltransferase involved in cell wall biosynthesis
MPAPPSAAPVRFTVVIATHDRARLLVEALTSVLLQTRAADEVIVVADGCSDETATIVRQRFPTVRQVEQSNTGLAMARNVAVARMTGDWICFLDDDDLWAPTKLARLEAVIEGDPDVRAVYHPVWTTRDGVVAGPVHTEDVAGLGIARLLLGVPSVPSALAVERETAVRAGLFPPHVAYGEDWIFDVNVGRLTEWRLLPEALATIRLDGERMSSPATRRRPTHFISAPLSLWTGRPRPDLLRSLRLQHRAMYRPLMQETLRRRRWREAAELARWLRVLLPRRRDRAFLVVPQRALDGARALRRHVRR